MGLVLFKPPRTRRLHAMASPSLFPTNQKASKSPVSNHIDQEERLGLLSDDSEPSSEHFYDTTDKNVKSRKRKMAAIAGSLIALLITGTFARTFLWAKPDQRTHSLHADDLFNNGTHQFKRTVVIVSIDGLRHWFHLWLPFSLLMLFYFRADYLDRGLTPHLLALSKKGLRAKSMKPIFPVRFLFPLFSFLLMSWLHRH